MSEHQATSPYTVRSAIHRSLFRCAIFGARASVKNTIAAYRSDLEKFLLFINAETSVSSLLAITSQDVEAYLAHRIDKGLKAKSNARAISALKRFYLYWLREKQIAQSPLDTIAQPKTTPSLPKTLSEQEVEALLNAPDCDDPMGLRDKAMLELLYATGLRVTELVGLRMEQVNMRQAVCTCPW